MRPTPPGFDPHVWNELEAARAQLASGDAAAAVATYRTAFDGCVARGDHYHASVVAHMAGVAETDVAKKHEWNLAALREADAVPDRARVRDTYASNYNNLGMSHAQLGERDRAIDAFERALGHVGDLPPGPYADQVRGGIERNLARAREPAGHTADNSRNELGRD